MSLPADEVLSNAVQPPPWGRLPVGRPAWRRILASCAASMVGSSTASCPLPEPVAPAALFVQVLILGGSETFLLGPEFSKDCAKYSISKSFYSIPPDYQIRSDGVS
eukprot:scaffold368_cov258-Pinguiococcus_pyrenoidosus.AAC.53